MRANAGDAGRGSSGLQRAGGGDTQTHLIVYEEVSAAVVDRGQLKPMVEGIRRTLGQEAFAVVAEPVLNR